MSGYPKTGGSGATQDSSWEIPVTGIAIFVGLTGRFSGRRMRAIRAFITNTVQPRCSVFLRQYKPDTAHGPLSASVDKILSSDYFKPINKNAEELLQQIRAAMALLKSK